MGQKHFLGDWREKEAEEERRKRMGAGRRNRHRQKCKWVLFIFQMHFTVWGFRMSQITKYRFRFLIILSLIGTFSWRKVKIFWHTEFISHLEVIDVIHMDIRWVVYEVWETWKGNTSTLKIWSWSENISQVFCFSVFKEWNKTTPGTKPTLPNPQTWLSLSFLFLNSIPKNHNHSVSRNNLNTHSKMGPFNFFFYLSRGKWFIRIISKKSFGFKNFK